MQSDQVEHVARLAQRSELLAHFGATALRHMPLPELLATAVACTERGVDARRVKILEAQQDGTLLVVAGVGWRPGVVGNVRLAGTMDSPPGRALLTGEPVVIEDLHRQSEFAISDLLREHNVVSLVNVPIKNGEFTFGVLEVDSAQPMRWTVHDVNFLHGFANLVTAAIQRNRIEEQRNILMREVQHRVKNNLQLVTSMMRASARASESSETRQTLDDLARRVTVVASVYQMLMSGAMDRISVRRYLGDLCSRLEMAADGVYIRTDLADRVIGIDEAISLGLITNELVINSLQHAFPHGGGTIRVSLKPTDEADWMRLTVADDGRGTTANRSTGFGTRMINLLATQLGGEIVAATQPTGSSFEARLRLPARDPGGRD
jgi:two-component sensor histidine kinase